MRASLLLIPFVLAASPGPASAERPEESHLAIEARISVDAQGRVESVSVLRPEMPAVLRDAAEAQVRLLRFEPFAVDGVPASVSSSVRLSACVRAEAESVVLAVEPVSFGPVPDVQSSFPIRDLFRAVGTRKGEYQFVARYAIEPDGHAVFHDLDARNVPQRAIKAVKDVFDEWISGERYTPERVNGQAVRTEMEFPMSLSVAPSRSGKKELGHPGICARAREAMSGEDAPRVAASAARLRLAAPES